MTEMSLVKLNADNHATTTTLQLAKAFGKLHKNVIQKIMTLECSEEFSRLNFKPSTFINSRGKSYKCYEITRDGFTYLANKFTGKKAARFTEKYIEAFNKMEAYLKAEAEKNQLSADQVLLIGQQMKYVEEKAARNKHAMHKACGRQGGLTKENNKLKKENTELKVENAVLKDREQQPQFKRCPKCKRTVPIEEFGTYRCNECTKKVRDLVDKMRPLKKNKK